MPVQRQFKSGGFIFSPPYWNELLPQNGGCLPADVPAHALFHYFLIAASAHDKEKHQAIYEGDPDADFHAAAVFKSVAWMHGVDPDTMLQYWPAVKAQVRMMGSDPDQIPQKYQFNRRTSA